MKKLHPVDILTNLLTQLWRFLGLNIDSNILKSTGAPKFGSYNNFEDSFRR
jgi:hypothetical protein